MIFTNRNELSEYIALLESIVNAMGEDLLRITNTVDKAITLDDLIDSYSRAVTSPSILESILIDRGELTTEEAKRNYLMESVFRRMKLI